MSTTDGRRERMLRLLKVMEKSKRSLTANEIAAKTDLLIEISQDRLHRYLAELEWCGKIVKQGNTYMVITVAPSKSRVREREREKGRKRE